MWFGSFGLIWFGLIESSSSERFMSVTLGKLVFRRPLVKGFMSTADACLTAHRLRTSSKRKGLCLFFFFSATSYSYYKTANDLNHNIGFQYKQNMCEALRSVVHEVQLCGA